MKKFALCIIIVLNLISTSFAQFSQQKIDDLKLKLIPGVQDTLQSDVLINIGIAFLSNNIDSSIYYVTKSLEMSKAIHDEYGVALATNSLANCDWRMSNYEEALKKYLDAIRYLESAKKKERIPAVNNNIGLIYTEMGYFEKAIEYFELAVKQKRENGLPLTSIATSINNIGNCYLDLNKEDDALPYFEEAYNIAIETNDPYIISLTTGNKATVYRRKGNLNKALELHKEALLIDVENEFNDMIPNSYSNVGTDLFKLNQFDEAKMNYLKSLEAAEEYGDIAFIADLHKNLSETEEMLGDKTSALHHFKTYHLLQDSILNTDMTEQMTEMQTKYETDKKELEIRVLGQDNTLKEKEISRQKLIRNGAMAGGIILLLFLSVVFFQKRKITKEKVRSEELLLNILPYETAQELKKSGSSEAKQFDEVTVLFTDFKGFTQIAENLTPHQLVAEIHHCFMTFDHIMEKYKIEKIKTIGDAYMAASGLPVVNKSNVDSVINAAIEIREFMHQYAHSRKLQNQPVFEIRIGIHTGPVVAGIVGVKKFAYDIWGDTVNIASRMESSGEAGKINISEHTYKHIKDNFICTSRGKIAAKGKGEIEMYFVERSI